MNKFIVLILVAVMILCLCACSSNKNQPENNTEPAPTETNPTEAAPTDAQIGNIDPALLIGVWESEHSILTINENGVGMYKMKEDDYKREFDLTWQIKDHQLYITIDYADMVHESIFVMNEDGISLALVQNMLPAHVTPDTDYFKQ